MNKAQKLISSFLQESINDKNKFKAIITAGGPGSGKSFIVDLVIGKSGPVSALGAVVIGSDVFFEHRLKKAGLSTKLIPSDTGAFAKQMAEREIAKELTKTKIGYIIDGMLPLVIDGTGQSLEKLVSQSKALQGIGYDTSMIFVNTSLDVAQARNQERKRSLPPEVVKVSWENVQKNMGAFQQHFENNFYIIDNNEFLRGQEFKDLKARLFKLGKKILESPIENKLGKTALETLVKVKGKYLSDIEKKANIPF